MRALFVMIFITFVLFVGCSAYPFVADPTLPTQGDVVSGCRFVLFSQNFTNYDYTTFPVNIPRYCFSSEHKIVLKIHLNVTAGIQFDRSIYVDIGDACVFVGTTSEPRPTRSPSWVVESDVTVFSSLIRSSSTGRVQLGTNISPTYNGVPFAEGMLEFYNDPGAPCPPEIVIPLGSGGHPLSLNVSNLPKNIAKAFVLFNAQGSGQEEFWWSNVPSNLSQAAGAYGGTAFRALKVEINESPVMVQNVVPYLFTGGDGPFLWIPTPGVQTLHLLMQRVDILPGFFFERDVTNLTISVMGPEVNCCWVLQASLFLELDDNVQSSIVQRNALPQALNNTQVVIEDNVVVDDSEVSGTLNVSFSVSFSQFGQTKYKNGKNEEVESGFDFSFFNFQNYSSALEVKYQQNGKFDAVQRVKRGNIVRETTTFQSYPLRADQKTIPQSDPNFVNYTVTFFLDYNSAAKYVESGGGPQPRGDMKECGRFQQKILYDAKITNQVFATSSMTIDIPKSSVTYAYNSASSQRYSFEDSKNNCYQKLLGSVNNELLTTFVDCDSLQFWVNPFFTASDRFEEPRTCSNAGNTRVEYNATQASSVSDVLSSTLENPGRTRKLS